MGAGSRRHGETCLTFIPACIEEKAHPKLDKRQSPAGSEIEESGVSTFL